MNAANDIIVSRAARTAAEYDTSRKITPRRPTRNTRNGSQIKKSSVIIIVVCVIFVIVLAIFLFSARTKHA